jgi:DNA (cytosine-5)-methyltransferase 1
MGARRSSISGGDARPIAIELFAGAGGLSLGFEQAGFRIALAVENDAKTCGTYRHNHPTVDLVEEDVGKVDPRDCMERIGVERESIAALIGGPPCQGFSESNRRTRTLDNPRNHYYVEFFRFLDAMRPLWFVLENVAGLRTLAGGLLLQNILDRGRRAGYAVVVHELDATEFGVPQVRRRIFVVGCRCGVVLAPPLKTHGPGLRPFVTVREAIGDLPRLKSGADTDLLPYPKKQLASEYQRAMRSPSEVVQGNLVTRNSDEVLARYGWIRPGQNWEAIPDDLMDNYHDATRCHTGIYYRLRADKPSKVIGNFRKNMLIHPSQNRGLSIREAARLQSFPDRYRFLGSIGFQQQQVADAVPPLLAEGVARALMEIIVKQGLRGKYGENRARCRSGTR